MPIDGRVYLDWNATAPPLAEVVEAMGECAREAWGNPASIHAHGRLARARVEGATKHDRDTCEGGPCCTDGDVDMLFGKELRKLPAGTAYRVPSTGKTAHANINVSAKTAEFLYMVHP